MRKRILAFCFIGMLLAGCGATESAEENPSTAPTEMTGTSSAVMESKEKITIQSGKENAVQIPIQIGSEKTTLQGILSMPKETETKPKLVILVHGSGQSDMNETIGTAGNAPFQDIAEGLAAQGIACLRYNKRYYEHKDKATAKVTIQDEVLDDVASAIQFVKTQDCCSGIYIAGHSLGAMLAPVIAKENPEVKGIVCLAGTPRTLQDVMYDQNAEALATGEYTAEQAKQQMVLIKNAVTAINNLTEGSTGTYFGVDAGYWYSLNQMKQADAAKELTIPIFMLQGSADFQVYADKDFKQWKKILTGKKNVTFRKYKGLNHLFMKTNGKRETTEYNTAGHVSEKVISDIAKWIDAD